MRKIVLFITCIFVITSGAYSQDVVKTLNGAYNCSNGTLPNALPTTNVFSGRDGVVIPPGVSIVPCATQSVVIKADNTYIPVLQSPGTTGSATESYATATDTDNSAYAINQALPVGYADGGGGVSPSGAGYYSVPIDVPSGPMGIKPNLSVGYNSQGRNGLLGWGWDLQGLSSIHRMPQKYYQDGINTAVDLSANDRFALDGNRLVNVSGAYGADATQYRTENESFVNVYSYNGSQTPAFIHYFKVYGQDGSELTYGQVNASATDGSVTYPVNAATTPYAWRISQYKDPYGNTVNYYYLTANGESRVDRIEYSQGNTATPFCKIYFSYAQRTDKAEYNLTTLSNSNVAIQQNVLLRKITVEVNNQLYKQYDFQYEFSDGYSKLVLVTEKESDGSTLNPTKVKWQAAPATRTTAAAIAGMTYGNRKYAGDFNGDGYSDILACSATNWGVWINNRDDTYQKIADQLLVLHNVHSSTTDYSTYPYVTTTEDYDTFYQDFYITDANNDGKDEIYAFYLSNDVRKSGTGSLLHGTSQSFNSKYNVFGVSVSSGVYSLSQTSTLWSYSYSSTGSAQMPDVLSDTHFFMSGDFDGNGQTDLLGFENGELNHTSNIQLTSSANLANLALVPVDINNDGSTELVSFTTLGASLAPSATNTSKVFRYNASTQTFDQGDLFTYIYQDNKNMTPQVADFNGDGKTDFAGLFYDRTQGSTIYYNWKVYQSNGAGYFIQTQYNTALQNIFGTDITDVTSYTNSNNILTGDFNGDGLTDILRIAKTGATSCTFTFNINRGNYGFDQYVYTNNAAITSFANIAIADGNADGKDDVLYDGQVVYFDKSGTSLLVDKVTDGLGRATSYTFAPLRAGSAYYTLSATPPAFPLQLLKSPFNVATALTQPDGVGGTSTTQYSYANGSVHLQGLGFLGFGQVTATNATLSTTVQTTYQNVGTNYQQMPSTVATQTAAGSPLSSAVYTNQSFTNFPTALSSQRFFNYVAGVTATDNLTGKVVTQANTYDNTYGVLTNVTTGYATVSVPAPLTGTESKTYHYHTIATTPRNVLDKVTSTSTIGSATAYTRTVDYTYTSSYPYLLQTTKSDAGQTNELLTTYSTWDVYGNAGAVSLYAADLTPATRTTTYTFDPSGRFMTGQTNALGTSGYTYDPVLGVPLTQTAPNGLMHTFRYDGQGRPVSSTDPLGIVSTLSYNWYSAGTVANAVYYTLQQRPGTPDSYTYYDVLGRSLRNETNGYYSASRGTSTLITKCQYDALGRKQNDVRTHYSGEADADYTLTYGYTTDGSNRMASVTDRTQTVNYSYSNLATSVADVVRNRSVTSTYNAMGLLVSSTDPTPSTNAVAYSLLHSSGQPVHIDANGGQVVIAYDDYSGLKTSVTDPASGVSTFGYYSTGELKTQTTPKGTFNMTYDVLGRLATSQNVTDAQTVTYVYHPAGTSAAGQLQSAGFGGTTPQARTFTYDSKGRPATATQQIRVAGLTPAFALTSSYQYDALGRVAQKTYPSGLAISYQYDATGTLVQMNRVDNGLNQMVWQLTDKKANGQPLGESYGNGLKATYSYQAPFDFQSNMTLLNSSAVAQYKYDTQFDTRNGNLTSRTNFYQPGSAAPLTETFTYDVNLDRLTTITNPTTPTTGVSIGYDNAGNITSKYDAGSYTYGTRNGGINTTNPVNPYGVSSVSLSTSTAIPSREQTIAYTAFGKVSTIAETGLPTATFTYGPDQGRIAMSNGDGTTVIYGDGYEALLDANGNITKEWTYIYSPNGLVAMLFNNAGAKNLYYTHTDHLGSVLLLSDQSGAFVSEKYSYDAWGRRRDPASWNYFNSPPGYTYLRRGYTFHEHLDSYGLINMNGRLYDPALGRMLSPDPVIQQPGYTQSYNRYSYCLNNPLKYIDPSGYQSDDPPVKGLHPAPQAPSDGSEGTGGLGSGGANEEGGSAPNPWGFSNHSYSYGSDFYGNNPRNIISSYISNNNNLYYAPGNQFSASDINYLLNNSGDLKEGEYTSGMQLRYNAPSVWYGKPVIATITVGAYSKTTISYNVIDNSQGGNPFDEPLEIVSDVNFLASGFVLGISETAYSSNVHNYSNTLAERATNLRIARNFKRAGIAGAAFGTILDLNNVRVNGGSYESYARLAVGAVITGIGFVPGIGVPASIGLGYYEMQGGLDALYSPMYTPGPVNGSPGIVPVGVPGINFK